MHQKEWTEVLEAHRVLVPWVKGKVYRPEELEPIQTGPLEGEQQIGEQEEQGQPEDLDAEGEVLGHEEWNDFLASEEIWRVSQSIFCRTLESRRPEIQADDSVL
jgi:hypothetical protein